MPQNLTEQPVKQTLLTMAAPAAIGMLMTFLFQLVDTYFVAKLGVEELAAISFAFPVYLLIVSIFMGLASGMASTVGKALGEQNTNKAARLTGTALLAFTLLVLGLAGLGLVSIDPVYSALGAGNDQLPLIRDYMSILYIGMFALVATLTANAALMAKGMMVMSTVVMGIGGVINLVLDYVLIFGVGPFPELQLKGAALATVISWSTTMVIMLIVTRKQSLLAFNGLLKLKTIKDDLSEIFSIGLPAVAAQVLNPIAIAVITRLVANSGEEAVAGYGIATRVESLGLVGIMALSVILTPVVAQNYGASLQARLDQIVAYAGRMTVYWGLGFFALMLIFAPSIAQIFTNDADVIEHSSNYLRYVGWSYPLFGLGLIATSYFNGVYQPKLSMKLTFVKTLGFTIPFALIGQLFGLKALWVAIAIANVAGAFYAGRLLFKWQRENDSSLVRHNPLKDYVDDFRSLFKKLQS